MSLLMQALRTAEKAKKEQAGAGADAAKPEVARPAPATSPAPPASPASLQLESLSLQPQEPTAQDKADAAEIAAAEALALDELGLDPVGKAPASVSAPAPASAPASASPPAAPTPATPAVDYFAGEARPAVEPFQAPVPPPPLAEPAPAAPPLRPILRTGLEQQQGADLANKKAADARGAASAVFAAKQRARDRRPMLIAGLGVLVLLLAAAYGYLEYARIANPPPLAMVQHAPVSAPAPVPVPVPVPVPAPAPAAEIAPAAPVLVPPEAAPKAVATEAAPKAVAPKAAVDSAAPAPRPAARPASRALPDAAPASAAATPTDQAPIAIRRNDASRQMNPALSSAYQAYQRGDMAAAQADYQRVLRDEANNRDALLGLAAIALNRGQGAQAGAFYTRLLELDPGDAEAATGLAGIERSDISQTESRLKKVLSDHPQTGSAQFALGNLYAQQGRWPEAQQAYFRAVGAVPASADYAFNLAVSLDKLSQPRLALEYYTRALQLARDHGGNLDQAAVRARIGQLQAAGSSAQ